MNPKITRSSMVRRVGNNDRKEQCLRFIGNKEVWDKAFKYRKAYMMMATDRQSLRPQLGENRRINSNCYHPCVPLTISVSDKSVRAYRYTIFGNNLTEPLPSPSRLTRDQLMPLLYHPFVEAQFYFSWYAAVKLLGERELSLTENQMVPYSRVHPLTVPVNQRNNII